MKKIILILAVMAMTVVGMQAQQRVPAYPGLLESPQPDGYVLRTYLRGDERHHWSMTEDGWQILRDDKGWFRYAKKNRKGEIVRHRRKAHNAEDRCCCERRWLEKHGVKKN